MVELDGAHHFTNSGSNADFTRDEYLKSLELTVIRFENKEVFKNSEGVLEEIKSYFRNDSTRTPPASGHP